MIAVSIALAIWTGGLTYFIAHYKRAQKEEHNVEILEVGSKEDPA